MSCLRPAPGAPWIFATILLLCRAALASGGMELLFLGGSAYYLLAGLALLASGALLWKGQRLGLWVYGSCSFATLIRGLAVARSGVPDNGEITAPSGARLR